MYNSQYDTQLFRNYVQLLALQVCVYPLATEVLKLLQQSNAIRFPQEVGHVKMMSALTTASFDSFRPCSILTQLSAPLYL